MSNTLNRDQSIKPTDLRGILKYVPMFRNQIFVIAIDGSLVAHTNFQNVLLDIVVESAVDLSKFCKLESVPLIKGIEYIPLPLSASVNENVLWTWKEFIDLLSGSRVFLNDI